MPESVRFSRWSRSRPVSLPVLMSCHEYDVAAKHSLWFRIPFPYSTMTQIH